ncbi:DUF3072 domain-containing protein [Mesobaculum littorinae]|uniref:DUF3072 domain-containing protein n=1 Tax=Mesobaculum littorinae TaxID=2486419 RepID=A0A438AI52_9RHOB|nr:DUF3072 domain-containing protein [Mesobaculum littorinae]RVV98421.1 DUF3072 domain-containing protein [Mesobaculum littorinae]
MSDKNDPLAVAASPAGAFATADTGKDDAPMTSEQADELAALSKEHGEAFDQSLTQDAAAARIEELKAKG